MHNPYLIEASKRYQSEITESFYINPISELDARIFEIIQDSIAAYKIESLHDILIQYKQISDKEILNLLEDYKIEPVLNKNFEKEELKEKSRFIKMNDYTQTRLQKRFITDYSVDIVIDADSEKEIPVIILNMTDPHNNKSIAYGNRHLFYSTFKDRNEDVLRLDQLL